MTDAAFITQIIVHCFPPIPGKGAAAIAGTFFIGVQTLSFYGYADVQWGKIERDMLKYLDVDGDGELPSSRPPAITRTAAGPDDKCSMKPRFHC